MASDIAAAAANRFLKLITRGIALGRLRTVVAGLEHIPSTGPALIVARHYHHLYDGVALFAALPRDFHLVVTLDWVGNRLTKTIMTKLTHGARWPAVLRGDALARPVRPDAVFSAREVLRYQRRAFRDAVELLADGRILVIFPEGYPNVDPTYTPKRGDEFLPFKDGFLRIASTAEKRLQCELPIIPAGFRYVSGSRWTAHLRFGPAVYRTRVEPASLITRLEAEVKRLSAPA